MNVPYVDTHLCGLNNFDANDYVRKLRVFRHGWVVMCGYNFDTLNAKIETHEGTNAWGILGGATPDRCLPNPGIIVVRSMFAHASLGP